MLIRQIQCFHNCRDQLIFIRALIQQKIQIDAGL